MLELRGLTKRFGGLCAVDAVSFALPAEGISALIGPNGAGKTTLFNMIAGKLRPTTGRVLFGGEEITGLPMHRVAARGIIRTFQLVRLFDDLSVAENVAVGCHRGTSGGIAAALLRPGWVRRQERAVQVRAAEMLDLVGLGHLAGLPAGQLTYGHQRLLEIARAVAADPKLLLLDEPAAGLNAAETVQLAATMTAITQRGVGILLIEHDMDLVMKIAERVIVLDFGRKIAEGAPAGIAQDPAVLAAYLGVAEEREHA